MAQASFALRLRAGLARVVVLGGLCLSSACIGGPHPLPPHDDGPTAPNAGAAGASFSTGSSGSGAPTTVNGGAGKSATSGAGGSAAAQAGASAVAGTGEDAGGPCDDASVQRALGDRCSSEEDGGVLAR